MNICFVKSQPFRTLDINIYKISCQMYPLVCSSVVLSTVLAMTLLFQRDYIII
jgi:hypothetical protein